MSLFMADIRKARREGRLQRRFQAADVRDTCPGWADSTYSVFLPKHRIGNPCGNAGYFVQHGYKSYSLIGEAGQSGQISDYRG